MFADLFANRISAFFGFDVMSGVAVIVWAVIRRGRVRLWWLPIACTVYVVPSMGLPLMLYLSEDRPVD